MNAIEKIKTVLKSSPYIAKAGGNIEGRFIIHGDNSIEFILECGVHFASYLFDEDDDLIMTVTPKLENNKN